MGPSLTSCSRFFVGAIHFRVIKGKRSPYPDFPIGKRDQNSLSTGSSSQTPGGLWYLLNAVVISHTVKVKFEPTNLVTSKTKGSTLRNLQR